MSEESPLTIKQLAEVLKVPETLILSFREQGLLPSALEDSPGEENNPDRYLRSEVVRALRQNPEAMDAVRRAMRQ